MARKKNDPDSKQSRNFKLLLYPYAPGCQDKEAT